jgi:hypothetical protein
MLPRPGKLRAIFARLGKLFNSKPCRDVPLGTREFHRACKELAFWSVSDAGLSGPIEAFDGSALHPAADGLFTIRMTLQDSLARRSPADAANLILRSLDGLRILLLLDIDGRRFTYTTPHVNAGIRELCQNFTNRTESTG